MSPTVGKANHTAHDLVADPQLGLKFPNAATNSYYLPVGYSEPGCVARVHPKRKAALARHQLRNIVKPTIGGAQIATTN